MSCCGWVLQWYWLSASLVKVSSQILMTRGGPNWQTMDHSNSIVVTINDFKPWWNFLSFSNFSLVSITLTTTTNSTLLKVNVVAGVVGFLLDRRHSIVVEATFILHRSHHHHLAVIIVRLQVITEDGSSVCCFAAIDRRDWGDQWECQLNSDRQLATISLLKNQLHVSGVVHDYFGLAYFWT